MALNYDEPYLLHDADSAAHRHAEALLAGLRVREEEFEFSSADSRRFRYELRAGNEGSGPLRVVLRAAGTFAVVRASSSAAAAAVELKFDAGTPKELIAKYAGGLLIRGGALVCKRDPTLCFV